jgi:hypothetical protein
MTDAKHVRQFPPKITISTPMYTPMLRGVQAARGPYALGPLGANLRVRVSRLDYQDIVNWSDQLGMKPAAFVRWCAVEVAHALTDYVNREEDVQKALADAEAEIRSRIVPRL